MNVERVRSSIEIEIRHATPDDAGGIAALFDRVYHGGYLDAECVDPALVRQAVTSGDHPWVLALAEGTVIGSVMARRDVGNAAYELCRAAIDEGYRGRDDIGAALDLLLHDTIGRPDCEVLFGNVRSERARRKFGRQATGWAWTGTDNGMHMMLGEREEHLFGMAFNPRRTVTRIRPHRPVLLPDSVVAREIDRLSAHTRVGGYPARICAASPSGPSPKAWK